MVQPVGILLLAVLLLLMMAGAMIGSFIWPDQEPTPFWAYLILMAMVALSLYLIADYRYARHMVSDSGMGLGHAPPRPGGGVGLSNLRERVRQLHGPTAQLQLIENQACGVTSRLLLPLTKVTPSTPPAP